MAEREREDVELVPEDEWVHRRDVSTMLDTEEPGLVDRRGRRWRLRPHEPGRYDYLGFTWSAWLVIALAIGTLVVWWAVAWY